MKRPMFKTVHRPCFDRIGILPVYDNLDTANLVAEISFNAVVQPPRTVTGALIGGGGLYSSSEDWR